MKNENETILLVEKLITENRLLKSAISKYILHVDFSEGTTFLSESSIKNSEINFTKEEIEILKRFS